MIIRHFGGGVHRHLFKRHRPGAENIVVLRFGNLITPGTVRAGECAFIAGIALGNAIEHPEGDIDALDLLNVVFAGEGPGKEKLALVVLFQRMNGVLLAEFERKHKVRL